MRVYAIRIASKTFSRSSSTSTRARALIYNSRGEPSEVLRGHTYDLRPPQKGEVRVRFKLSPQNPADLNVIQGSYPERPLPRKELAKADEEVFIGGNEGLAIVEDVPEGTDTKLKQGDRVVMGKAQLGTWTSRSNISASSLFPVSEHFSEIQAATLMVNPSTAYRMLKDFVNLKEGDWVLQNGANSQVGLAVIQLAKAWGIKTANFVRDREDMSSLKSRLQSLGATEVFSYADLADKSFKSTFIDKTSKAPMQLALNCVGGKDTSNMAKLLAKDATMVTYGAMSMQPLSLPSSLHIFKNLTSQGFWMTTWYKQCTFAERRQMYDELAAFYREEKLQEPDFEVVELSGYDDDIGRKARDAIKSVKGKKVIFKFPDDA